MAQEEKKNHQMKAKQKMKYRKKMLKKLAVRQVKKERNICDFDE
jgi:hypothetical protein